MSGMNPHTGRIETARRPLERPLVMTVISVKTKYFPSSRPSSPALVVQVTCLADSYMIWVGATAEPEEKTGSATLQGHLGKDWVVAMPPWKVRAHRMAPI